MTADRPGLHSYVTFRKSIPDAGSIRRELSEIRQDFLKEKMNMLGFHGSINNEEWNYSFLSTASSRQVRRRNSKYPKGIFTILKNGNSIDAQKKENIPRTLANEWMFSEAQPVIVLVVHT